MLRHSFDSYPVSFQLCFSFHFSQRWKLSLCRCFLNIINALGMCTSSYISLLFCCLVAKLCPTLYDSMDCSPPDSSVCGIFQERILEWVAVSFSRGSSWSKDQTHISCICRQILFFSPFIFISSRLIILQYCRGFCHTLTWINHGFTCISHPNPPSHLPVHPIPLGLPSAPVPSTSLMHPTWAGDLSHPW